MDKGWLARLDAFRPIASLINPWRGWLSCGIFVFLALTGAVGLVRGDRSAIALTLVGIYGLGTIVWSWYRVDAHRLRTGTRVLGNTEQSWARELPITPAVALFVRRRLLTLTLVAEIAGCAIASVILALTARLPHLAHIVVLVLSLMTLLTVVIGVLTPAVRDVRTTTFREVAGPISLTIGWRGAAAQYALRVGEETVWIPMATAACLRGLQWGVVSTTRRTGALLEVRDTEGTVIYRTPGYPGTTTIRLCRE